MAKRVIFITGANGGLGTSVTRRFLSTGDIVVGASRKISHEDFPGSNFVPCSADLTSPDAARAAIDSTAAKFGGIHVLVHVLGGFAGGEKIADMSDATWKQMQDLNLNSAFYVLRAALPHLRKSGSGRVVAVGSLTATAPHAGLAAYVVSKAALVKLIQTVALENRDAGVTANVVLPGTMDTPANRKSMPGADFSKWVQPRDVADLIAYLADEDAGHITGTAVSINDSNH
jgi:NAD(P)-dependent dehydrogenase (short-subunit alcohol dehydrogenase family)